MPVPVHGHTAPVVCVVLNQCGNGIEAVPLRDVVLPILALDVVVLQGILETAGTAVRVRGEKQASREAGGCMDGGESAPAYRTEREYCPGLDSLSRTR